jgi:DnaJ-class molecular chaperone
MDERMKIDLDNYITGHWGEDQIEDEADLGIEDDSFPCRFCNGTGVSPEGFDCEECDGYGYFE